MTTPTYTFEEFCDHLAAMEVVRDYRHVTLGNGENIELDDTPNFETMTLRTMDYMRQIYSDEREAFFKGARFMMILNHAASELKALEDAGLAVIGGEGKASLVHPRAWRALHYHYAVKPATPHGRTMTEDVVAYAMSLPEESENENRA